jgi:arginase
LRSAGLLDRLGAVRDAGRLAVGPWVPRVQGVTDVTNAAGIADFAMRLAERVGDALDRGERPLILGGDCSILLGSMLALRRRGRFGLVFIDGHADFYSPEKELNGEAASMDLALVTGHGPDALVSLDGWRPLVRESDVVLFGYRDARFTDADGSPDVRESAVHVLDLLEVRRLGAANAARRALETLLSSGVDGVFVHLDADVLHDDVMPAVDYRMPDGLWPDELTAALAVLLGSQGVVGMEVTIYNPTFDDEERSAARVLSRCISDAFVV